MIIRLPVISSEVLDYGPTLPDVTYPTVGCFVACMPTYSPLVKPLRHVRDYVSLVGVPWTRSSNASRKGTTKIEDSNADNFYLANYKPASTREVTVARNPQASTLDKNSTLFLEP
ncbi:hypothetical protein BCON_0013g00460 [Botryotinia convoluta]|uniref:Uncharacterized protein n=1 Tax=Botryotinia convoluta TaxID=54673 RepID=A0A4Z1IVJ6_9HELO|nr:hypothetical protein BCON_0013g00460 [Botryotinia convoluta]